MMLIVELGICQEKPLDLPRIPLTESYETSEFGAGIQNLNFDQDSSKNLFVANNFGLLEYDGREWLFHQVPSSTKTRSVFIDSQDRIFIGGQGQLGYFKRGQFGLEFTSLLDISEGETKTISEVWSIYETGSKIYIQTIDQLLILSGDEIKELPLPTSPISSFPLADRVIVQLQSLDLYQEQDGKLTPLEGTGEIDAQVNGVVESPGGFIIFLVNGKILKFENGGLTRIKTRINHELEAAQINVCIELSDGRLAVGTQNDGLFILSSNFEVLSHLTKNKGLNHRTVYALYEDHNGMLWVGLNNGITYVEQHSPLSIINEDFGLEGTGYSAIKGNGHVYLGTSSGLFLLNTNNDEFELIENSLGQAYNLSTIKNDIYLSHNDGIFEITENGIEQLYDQDGAWKLAETINPNVLIGGTYSGLIRMNKGNGSVENILGEFNESSRVFEFENDSVLWVSHGYKGAFRLTMSEDFTRINKIETYGQKDGFPSDLLISVYKLNGQLVFTSERGIFHFDSDEKKFVRNEFLDGFLGEHHVSKLAEDDRGTIYFISGNEIGLLKQNGFENYEKVSQIFKKVNRFLSNDLENINILDSRNVLFGAKEGFIHYDPAVDSYSPSDLRVNLRSVVVNFSQDSTASYNPYFFNELELTGINSLKFSFSSPDFDPNQETQFSYRLVPFENSWSNWSNTGFKEYTNLPANSYTFQVRAKNETGLTSETKSINFEIEPVWYQSNLAILTYIAMALCIFGLMYYRQGAKHKTERAEIYSQKEMEIKERDQKINEISEESAKRIESLKNEKLQAEIKYKNSELASVTMHLLSKNEFVQDVRKRISEISKSNHGAAGDLKKIVKTIDQNLVQDESWDQFAIHFDQVHGDFFKKLAQRDFKLTPQETKLAAYLRMNMSSKEIANLMNISVRGVELARYRLRKKIQLERDQNLVEYLMSI